MNDITELKAFLTHLHEKYRNHHEGAVATYIPALANTNPDYFGISIASVDGQQFSVGDCDQEFTLQSICKPLAFLMALERTGREHVLQHVGVEPSGEAFNSVELTAQNGRPFNPMANAWRHCDGGSDQARAVRSRCGRGCGAVGGCRRSHAANRRRRVCF